MNMLSGTIGFQKMRNNSVFAVTGGGLSGYAGGAGLGAVVEAVSHIRHILVAPMHSDRTRAHKAKKGVCNTPGLPAVSRDALATRSIPGVGL